MKMNKERDIKNYDYLTIIIKKEKQAEVLENYACFGWEIVNTKELNDEHISEVDLKRPHKINNKDELQYLQVNMESELNKLGKIETEKHSKSTILGIVSGILCIAMIVFGVIMAVKNYLEINLLVGGILLGVAGLTILIVMTFVIIKIAKKELGFYEINSNKTRKSISSYCKMAKDLREVENGNK